MKFIIDTLLLVTQYFAYLVWLAGVVTLACITNLLSHVWTSGHPISSGGVRCQCTFDPSSDLIFHHFIFR